MCGSLILACLCVLGQAEAQSTGFFVSPGGEDAGPGTLERPFATLERARDAVRQLRAAGSLPPTGMTIWLRGGDYFRTSALELSAADSGTADAPVAWRSYGDEAARLVGGRRLSGFQPVTDTAVLARLPESARGQVRQVDLAAIDIASAGGLRSRGFGRPVRPAHSELFCDGRPMTLARWPNEGQWVRIAGFPKGSGQPDEHGGSIGRLEDGFTLDNDRPFGWKDTNDVWVHGYWAWDWANSYERVEALDPARKLVRTAPPRGHYGFRPGQRVCFLNVLEELDQPGEWFLDRAAGRLYFWPPHEAEEGPDVMLSLLEQPLIRMIDVAHVAIRGLTLEATRGDAVVIQGGSDVRVQGCRIRNVGNRGVVVQGGTDHAVRACDIEDSGDGGVSLSGGDRKTLEPGGHLVEDCRFARQGRWSKCYVPAIALEGVGLRAAHNLIAEHPHAAILFGGNDHRIEFNEIHHVALETGDVGAIYTGRDFTYRGNVIRHNYIHHTGGVGMGSMGVYMDDCVSGTEVFGNIFQQVHWAMFIGGGRDHRVENNLFVDCDPAVVADGRGLDTSPVWRGMVDETMRRRLKAVPLDLYRARYPAMTSLDAWYGPPGGAAIAGTAFTGVPPEGNVIAHNVCMGDWLKIQWLAEPSLFEIRDNFVTLDRGQVGGPETGFALPKDSPAWNLGFEPIPFDRIGPRPSEDRTRLERVR